MSFEWLAIWFLLLLCPLLKFFRLIALCITEETPIKPTHPPPIDNAVQDGKSILQTSLDKMGHVTCL